MRAISVGTRVRITSGYRAGWEAIVGRVVHHKRRHDTTDYWLVWPEDARPADKMGQERDAGWYGRDEFEPVGDCGEECG